MRCSKLRLVLAVLLRNGSTSHSVIGFLVIFCLMLFIVGGFGLLLQLLQLTSYSIQTYLSG